MVYLITNRKLIKGKEFIIVLKEVVRGGIDAIILREKDLDYEDLLKIAVIIKDEVIMDKHILLIVNSNLPVARAVHADGYHCSFKAFLLEGPVFNGLNGVSVHTVEEAAEAERLGADYLLASHIFKTDCKAGKEPAGINLITDIKTQVNIPVIALGGINAENAGSVLSAGADGIAVMSYIMQASDPYVASQQLKRCYLYAVQ